MWDLALDNRTGDMMFTANRDAMAISGSLHIVQRIFTRLRIKRGLWVYDTDGDLGSRLDLTFGYDPDRAAREIPAFVREALAPMADIEVDNITVLQSVESSRQLHAEITYRVLTQVEPITETIVVPLSA